MNAYDTLSQAVEGLHQRGYTLDFKLEADCLHCAPEEVRLSPDQFIIAETHRFEGMSSTDDNSVLYAIESTDGRKGIVVDAYGVYASELSAAMLAKLRTAYPK